MADRQDTSRRSTSAKQTASRSSMADRQPASRRSDVIRCENCGEDYSVTYKRCPFCDERPGRGVSGRRVAGGETVHPVQVIGLVVSLALIIAALFIVFKYIGPLLFGGKKPGGQSSVSTSQSQIQPGGSSSGVSVEDPGDISQPDPVLPAVDSISLNKVDFTLKANEFYRIVATVTPAGSDAEVVWTSSNPSALAVEQDGTVTNINSGSSQVKVTVTATCGGKSAECTVYCRGGSSSTGTGTGNTGSNTGGTVTANSSGTVVNAGGGLNIRSGPGSSYEAVASAKNGDKVTILEDAGGGWYKVDYGGGKTGYVSSDYISVGG